MLGLRYRICRAVLSLCIVGSVMELFGPEGVCILSSGNHEKIPLRCIRVKTIRTGMIDVVGPHV